MANYVCVCMYEIKFLDHLVNAGGIRPLPEKLADQELFDNPQSGYL